MYYTSDMQGLVWGEPELAHEYMTLMWKTLAALKSAQTQDLVIIFG